MDVLVNGILIAEGGHPFNQDKDSTCTMLIRGTLNRHPLLHLINSPSTSIIPINSFVLECIRTGKPIMVQSTIDRPETPLHGARDDQDNRSGRHSFLYPSLKAGQRLVTQNYRHCLRPE